MIKEKYNISGLGEVCHYLEAIHEKANGEDWQIDFYNTYNDLLFSFENDDETLQALKDENDTYQLVVESMDIAMMMGKEL